MSDFHVVAVHYQASAGDFTQYDSPPPLAGQSHDFDYELANDHLTLRPIQHFATEAAVRPVADAFVQAWEISSGLDARRPQIHFSFERVEIIDRDPPPAGSAIIGVAQGVLALTMSGTLSVTRHTYPSAPSADFGLTTDVTTLWARYQQYVSGGEPILSMANFVLTYIETHYGGTTTKRRAAAAALNVEYDVLSRLGHIAGTYGDDLEARKRSGPVLPLTASEIDWVDAAVRALIQRVAQTSAVRAARRLTLADLP